MKLQEAQERVGAAIVAASTADTHLGQLRTRQRDFADDRAKRLYLPIGPDAMDDRLRWEIDQDETEFSGAASAYEQAVADRYVAVSAVINRIQPTLQELNDSSSSRWLRRSANSATSYTQSVPGSTGSLATSFSRSSSVRPPSSR